MSLYTNYLESVKKSTDADLTHFKSTGRYNDVLEHLSPENGQQYLQNILREFPEISKETIYEYVSLNDRYGSPHQYFFADLGRACSPTSLRYVYHALLILTDIQEHKNKQIVEIGCGYGGLFLAIQFFAKRWANDCHIEHYHFIDLPDVGGLIQKYLALHQESIDIPYSIHSSEQYGEDISSDDNNSLFLISNYCLTEIDTVHRQRYLNVLFPKVHSGFIVWQSYIGYNIVETLKTYHLRIEDERPQTAGEYKNYYVHFFTPSS